MSEALLEVHDLVKHFPVGGGMLASKATLATSLGDRIPCGGVRPELR